MNKRVIKRLNLPRYMTRSLSDRNIKDLGLVQIDPEFNKPGWYHNRLSKKTWYETKDGRAFLCKDSKRFLHEFRLLNNRHFEPYELKAIVLLLNSGVPIGKDLRTMYMLHVLKMSYSTSRRNAKLTRMKFIKDHGK